MNTRVRLFLSLLMVSAGIGHAEQTWLNEKAIDIQRSLAAPPSIGSKAYQADVKRMLQAQASRTEGDCARAKASMISSFKNYFGPPYGPLSTTDLEKWSPFFETIFSDTIYFSRAMKEYWKYPRPYRQEKAIVPCIPTEGLGWAYPSGHATMARVLSRILILLKPEKADLIKARAAQISWDRVISGVHWPVDIEAGEKLGDLIAEKFLSNTEFQRELKLQKTK